MRLLLDSCTFLWLIWDEPALSDTAREQIADSNNEVFLSAASIWEITVKHLSGRLELRKPVDPATHYSAQRQAHGIAPLPVDEAAVSYLPRLPDIHRDPFDRMLVCQAMAHELVVVTPDKAIGQYPVTTLW